ncbi:uncharacterized protein LOC116240973 [Phasianus colchicus]|uniref:uncharacterized protein LOC116240973 n=1 Tax=Phasianus colchicus TaxID=9054 RepID=UPI00129DCFCE|nr:uncharacterized protein LOC116240973 [Phasianus colchicus]
MAAEDAWTCPVCRDVRQDIAYVIPCNHMFCTGCILQWAMLRNSCPLCRTVMQTIRVSVPGGNLYVECIVSPPALPMPVSIDTITATGPDSAEASLSPPPPPSPELIAPEPERVGGLLAEEWAALFTVRRDILDPVLPWLEQQLSHIHVLCQWQINWLKNMIVSHLCQVGLDRDALAQRLQGMLGPIAMPFTEIIIEIIQRLCIQEARRLLGLEDSSTAQEQQGSPEDPGAAQSQEDGPAAASDPAASSQDTAAPSAEELPGTSSGALSEVAGELPAAPSPREREQPSEEPSPEAAGPSEQLYNRGPSTRGRGRKRSARRPRRPTKRRAGSAQRDPPPSKRRRPRRL